MNLFEFELLKMKRNHFFNFFFLLLLILILLLGRSFQKGAMSDYSVSLGYIDNDASEESSQYLKKLEQKDIIDLVELSSVQEGEQKLSSSQIEAMLVIPDGYFEMILKEKIEYKYLRYSVIAPALIDLLADDLMLSISKAKLIDATKRYLSDEAQEKSLAYYGDFLENNSFFLETKLEATDNAKGLKVEYHAKKISHGRNVLGYAMAIFIFTLVFSLAVSEFKNRYLNYRKLSIDGFYQRAFLVQRVFDYLKISVLWVFLLFMVAGNIGLKFENAMLLLVFSLICLILYYEMISFLYRIFDKSHVGNLIAIGFVMLSSIFGGAYFPTDLFPKVYDVILGWIPFYQLNEMYYACISENFAARRFGYLFVYLVLALFLVIGNYRRDKRSA